MLLEAQEYLLQRQPHHPQRGQLAVGLLLSKCWHLKSKFSHLGNALHLLKVTHVLMRGQDFAVPNEA